MFSLGSATKIFLAAGSTDMRKSFDTLAAIVKTRLQQDPLSGHIFVFCNRRLDRIKLLIFDGSGIWILAKRLEKGRFRWPEASNVSDNGSTFTLNHQELAMLLGGVDLSRTTRRRWWRRE
jgi:transposase